MEPVIRRTVIGELDKKVSDSLLVTLSAAAGGGVSTLLDQWIRDTRFAVLRGACPDLVPQRPLAAFEEYRSETATAAIAAGDWTVASSDLGRRIADDERPGVIVIDDADHLDQASALLAAELVGRSCRIVLGHHHAPSTNPSLELLIESVAESERNSMIVPPLDEAEIDAALGDSTDAASVRVATGGNPLAVSLYRGSDFASIATAVFERFDRLTADGQGLAAILAANPEPLALSTLDSLGRPWTSHGRSLEKSGLTIVTDDRVALRHDKIRRVLYEDMTAVRRRFVHTEILGQLRSDDDFTLVMYHAVGAGDVETIVTLGPQAAKHAAVLGARREAVKHLENVLAYEHSVPEADRTALRSALESHLAETTR